MRIIIEADANVSTAVTSQAAVPSTRGAANGGAAPRLAQRTASNTGATPTAHNAGSPPRWLHDAIASGIARPRAIEKKTHHGGSAR